MCTHFFIYHSYYIENIFEKNKMKKYKKSQYQYLFDYYSSIPMIITGIGAYFMPIPPIPPEAAAKTFF